MGITDWTVMRHIARPALAATMALGLAGGIAGSIASAQDGPPAPPPPPANCTEIATGLNSPRQFLLGSDGTLYIAEAGTGGDEVVTQPPVGESEVGTPAAEVNEPEATPADAEAAPAEGEAEGAMPPSTRGYTGQVTAIAPDGTQSVLADGFASYSDGVGPSALAEIDGMLYLAVGGSGYVAGAGQIEGENVVFAIDPATGEATELADLGQIEIDENPDGQDVTPNLYAMVAGPDGLLYVADAGGNTIYTVDPATGEAELYVVLPTLDELLGGEPTGTPVTDAAPPRQAVPTALAFDPEGNLVVGMLSEGWPADAPNIVRVEADQTVTPIAYGLQALVSIGYGPDGALYAVQLTTDFMTLAPGVVMRIGEDGTATPALESLFLPHGLAFQQNGTAMVGTMALALGPGMTGSALSCTDVAPSV